MPKTPPKNTPTERLHKNPQAERLLEAISGALGAGTTMRAKLMINGLHPSEIADLIESLPQNKRSIVWAMLDRDQDGEILLELGDEVRSRIISEMDEESLLLAIEGLDIDDLADLLVDFPDTVMRQVLDGMDYQYRQRIETILDYDEDTAGGLMNTDAITIRANLTVEVVLRYLRIREAIPSNTDSLIVVDYNEHYLGVLHLPTLLSSGANTPVSELMDTRIKALDAETPAAQVATLFEDRDLLSAAVIDEEGGVLGRITVDDVIDIIREEGENTVYHMAGLAKDEDLFSPIIPAAKRRGVWLGINLFTAIITAIAIGFFQETIQKVVALAVLMPIVASMGGIAGGQTLTLVIRGLALGQVARSNARVLMSKEVIVSALNSILWGAVVAIIAAVWFNDKTIGLIIALAMIANLIFAAIAGVSIPMVLRKLGVDPALAGNVLLTTFTDVIGFVVFLGLGTMLLL
ncbi:MAG: magnesium transporter [Pseudomonadota bacterium]